MSPANPRDRSLARCLGGWGVWWTILLVALTGFWLGSWRSYELTANDSQRTEVCAACLLLLSYLGTTVVMTLLNWMYKNDALKD